MEEKVSRSVSDPGVVALLRQHLDIERKFYLDEVELQFVICEFYDRYFSNCLKMKYNYVVMYKNQLL